MTLYTSRDLAIIAVFAAVNFVVMKLTGPIHPFLPFSTLAIFGWLFAFIAVFPYLATGKVGAAGLSVFVGYMLVYATGPFPPFLFQTIVGPALMEVAIGAAVGLRARRGAAAAGLAGGSYMLGRVAGGVLGAYLFLPSIVHVILEFLAPFTSLIVVPAVVEGIIGGIVAQRVYASRVVRR
ncbi:MAG: hypothetical protein ACP5G6_06350 [Conexivisphaera sp.]|jgi:hypothetical protein|nr:hypothetical protein [Conexivisphaerales archaeon]